MDVINIAQAPYTLKPKVSLGIFGSALRRGALLRMEFKDGSLGYCDCHPWPELGDIPIEGQLKKIKNGELTSLMRKSLYFAQVDAQARKKYHSLFDHLQIPPSHCVVNSLEEVGDYPYLKIKIDGRKAPPPWLKEIPADRTLRLDFNCSFKLDQQQLWKEFCQALSVDFLEDPVSYEPHIWQTMSLGRALALDRDSEKGIGGYAEVLVVKPAYQETYPFENVQNQRIIFTSYLDHPLGQLTAAWEAACFYKKRPDLWEPSGLLSHLCYEPNDFSEALKVHSNQIIAPGQYGFGFDELLTKQNWKPI